MPRLDDSTATLLYGAQRRVQRVWDGFLDFALRDNVLEVALGLIVGAAFTQVVTSFVSDLLLPIISLLPFLQRNLSEKFAVLRKGPHYSEENGYNTLKQAQDDGALVLGYGVFLEKSLRFLGVSLTLYAIAQLYTWLSDDPIVKHQVKCKYCRKWISEKAKRCVNCSSWQDGREDCHAQTEAILE